MSDEARLPNVSGVGANTFNATKLKAKLIARLGERLKELGEGMASCNTDDQFRRMAQSKNEFAKAEDERFLISHGISGHELQKYMLMIENGTHGVFAAANGIISVRT